MSDIVDSVVNAIVADSGVSACSDSSYKSITAQWEALSQEHKVFLADLTKEEFENVVIGEVRESPEGGNLWLIKGAWVPLPAPIEDFLEFAHYAIVDDGV